MLALALAATVHPVTSSAEPVSAREGVTLEVTPRRIVMAHAYEWVTWSFSGLDVQDRTCDLYFQSRASGEYHYLGASVSVGHLSGVFNYYGGGVRHPGAYRPVVRCTRPQSTVLDNYPAAYDIVIKYGSRAGVRSVSRGSGGTTVKGVAKVWDPADLVFRGWANARVAVQVKKPSGWTTARIVTSGAGGAVKATFSTTSNWSWRLVTLGSSRAWPSTLASPPIPLSKTLRIDAVPERIAVNQDFAPVTWAASRTDGEALSFCNLWVENKRSRDGIADDADLRENQSSGQMRIYHANVEPGLHNVVMECHTSGVAVDEVMIKWGSRSRASSVTRSSGRTAVKGVVKRWTIYEGGKFIGWSNARVAVQVKKASGWTTARIVRASASGAVSATFSTSTNLPWRLVALESPHVWGSTSAAAQG
ncbi:hypothetical protein ASD81_15200 [Nocardioides sp. Root614]|nr:hypothetical protein ASD81_15200 [Nocardioides sp. Root614]KRA87478.1 hypothetical protein ASD84_15470 [Nocardioides sp. Root682]